MGFIRCWQIAQPDSAPHIHWHPAAQSCIIQKDFAQKGSAQRLAELDRQQRRRGESIWRALPFNVTVSCLQNGQIKKA